MTREQVQADVEVALSAVDPTEVRVHFDDEDVLYVLVLSDSFKGLGWGKRIRRCVELLCDHADEVASNYTFIVEPVTPIEFKDRLVPWPE